MNMRTLLVFAILAAARGEEMNPECDEKYKEASVKGVHTACLMPSPDLVQVHEITAADRREIVSKHNEFRKDEDATDMLRMTWDDELAMLAEKWASTCPRGHDKGSLRAAVGRFGTGQNIYYSSSTMVSFSKAITGWASEKKDFTFGGTRDAQTGVVGHYTQVVWANTFLVGCAAVECENHRFKTIYVCNYGPLGNKGKQLFKPFHEGEDCDDCPGHCKGGVCDCRSRVCLNDGSINLETCKCKCYKDYPWYTGVTCKLDCTKVAEKRNCKSVSSQGCAKYKNLRRMCPNKCGVCPVV